MGAKALLLALVVGCSVAFAGLVILDKAGRGPCAGVVAARALAGAAAKASGQASLNKIVPASICASAAPGSLDDKVQPATSVVLVFPFAKQLVQCMYAGLSPEHCVQLWCRLAGCCCHCYGH